MLTYRNLTKDFIINSIDKLCDFLTPLSMGPQLDAAIDTLKHGSEISALKSASDQAGLYMSILDISGPLIDIRKMFDVCARLSIAETGKEIAAKYPDFPLIDKASKPISQSQSGPSKPDALTP